MMQTTENVQYRERGVLMINIKTKFVSFINLKLKLLHCFLVLCFLVLCNNLAGSQSSTMSHSYIYITLDASTTYWKLPNDNVF